MTAYAISATIFLTTLVVANANTPRTAILGVLKLNTGECSLKMIVGTEINGFAMSGQGFKAPVVREWLSTSEAAEIAAVDQSTVIRWCQRFGTVLARRVRGRWRIKPEALAKLLEGEELGANGKKT